MPRTLHAFNRKLFGATQPTPMGAASGVPSPTGIFHLVVRKGSAYVLVTVMPTVWWEAVGACDEVLHLDGGVVVDAPAIVHTGTCQLIVSGEIDEVLPTALEAAVPNWSTWDEAKRAVADDLSLVHHTWRAPHFDTDDATVHYAPRRDIA